MTRRRGRSGRDRRGVALVAAMGLLLLAAALLVGSAVASVELRRAARARVSAARARTEAARGLAEVLRGWDASLDSLPVGAARDRRLAPVDVGGPAVAREARVERLTATVYAATIAVRVGDAGAPLAGRRARLLLHRAEHPDDSAAVAPVTALGRWALTDLP